MDHLSRRLTPTELNAAANRLQTLIDEIAALGLIPDDTVGVFVPQNLWRCFFPPKEPAQWTPGICFGEGDFAGFLVPYGSPGRLQIAAHPPKTRWHRTYTPEQYVHDYLTAGNQLPHVMSDSHINSASWWLERLLPDGHELKRAELSESAGVSR